MGAGEGREDGMATFDYKTCANPKPNAESYLNNGVILIRLYAK